MVRLVMVSVPSGDLHRVMEALDGLEVCHDMRAFRGDGESVQLQFKCIEKRCSKIISTLESIGCGVDYGSIDVLNLTSTKPRIRKTKNEKSSKLTSLHDRLTAEEIYLNIDNESHMTFDYFVMIACAALIAGVGLYMDSPVAVVASMLVSPLMGPILSLTFGVIIGDRLMTWKGFRTEVFGIFLTFVVGGIVGLFVAPFQDNTDNSFSMLSAEMNSRGTWGALMAGAAIAAPSGIAVALGVTTGSVNPLVGCAISAALLPPIVNSGMSTILGVYTLVRFGETSISRHHLHVGYVSMLLFIINWLLIFLFACGTFKWKRIEPLNDENVMLERRFSSVKLTQRKSTEMSEREGLKRLVGDDLLIAHDEQPLRQPLVTRNVGSLNAELGGRRNNSSFL